MEENKDILNFVKAMATAERLRIIGLLTRKPMNTKQIAKAFGVHPSDVVRHLEKLKTSGVVSDANGVYELDEKAIESLARGQFRGNRPIYEVKDDEQDDVRIVLKNYLNADGTLKQIPPIGNKLFVILKFIVDAFDFEANYTEKEVNTILRRFHVDTAALRRYLVDHGLMARDSYGTKYWRVKDGEK